MCRNCNDCIFWQGIGIQGNAVMFFFFLGGARGAGIFNVSKKVKTLESSNWHVICKGTVWT